MSVEPLLYKSYVAQIKNSPGTKMYQDFFALVNLEEKNITENGNLSCAYYVTSILKNYDLIKNIHITVNSTVRDLEASGWQEVAQESIRAGDVILWCKSEIAGGIHRHIGFYVGDEQAVSNIYQKKEITQHHYTYDNQRKIEKVFTSQEFD